MGRKKNFSIEEDIYIKDRYKELFDDEIAEHLGRPVGSVTRRRQRLGCWYTQQEAGSSLKGEVWKQIPHLPDGYMVSNKGRIKTKGKLCSLLVRDNGYVQWRLVNPSIGLAKTFKVHRLVAEVFCETDKIVEDCDVHHIDHNRQNNSYDNLEWLTKEEHKQKH